MSKEYNDNPEAIKSEFSRLSEYLRSGGELEPTSILSLAKQIEQLAQSNAQNLDKNFIKAIFSLLDITSLNSCDTENSVTAICNKLTRSEQELMPAAVCFFPSFCEGAHKALTNSSIKLAVVEDSFPHGNSPLETRAYGVKTSIQAGADEIDMVISRGAANAGDFDCICQEVSTLKKACGEKKLKVILNTAELIPANNISLNRYSFIYKLSLACLKSGADFLKTSTGKEGTNADLADSIAMCLSIYNFNLVKEQVNLRGFKAAGGIKKIEDAFNYWLLADLTFESVNSTVFRIGASSLAKVLEDSYYGVINKNNEIETY
jgi:deoxyribose-phosphate aldolase